MSDEHEEPTLPQERTEEELEARHSRELEEMETKKQAHIEAAKASAGKGKKAKEKVDAAEREAEDWEYKLRVRQQAEMDLLLEHLAGGEGKASSGEGEAKAKEVSLPAESESIPEETEEEHAQRKKDKALRKKQNKASKEAERELEKEREKREAGPSQRQLELAALSRQLAALKPPMRIQEVAADGHCLYRSVGEQLLSARPDLQRWQRGPEHVHEEVRALCAKSLRCRSEDYGPFAELKDGEDFEGYCSRVQHSADWGGHLELRALADELGVRIMVHRADEAEPLIMGATEGVPLQVAYHRHYYTLGEHYNSVVPAGGGYS